MEEGTLSPLLVYMDIKKRTIEIIEEYLPADHFIVEVDFGKSVVTPKLSIILDGDDGVSIDTCALISRKVGYFLEQDNAIEVAYNLEVSSPGVDAPFQNIRQYHKNVGRDVKITLSEGKARIGVLEEVIDDQSILFLEQLKAGEKGRKAKFAEEPETIEIKNILKINVILTF
jgi:ribosome maturation factor RimP